MENLIEFFEKYWGYSLAGGLTLGTVITSIVVQIKMWVRDRDKNDLIGKLKTQVNDIISSADASVSKVLDKYNAVVEKNDELVTQNVLLGQVQTATFKTLSYLVMSSKLPIEEKVALQTEYNNLLDATKTATITEVKENVEDIKEDIGNVLADTINTATSILDKYTTTSGGN